MTKCVVCSEPVRRPRLLSCLHSVCSGCVQHIARDAVTVSCPNCLRLTSVVSVFSLPCDYVSAREAVPPTEPQTQYCEECAEEREATCKCSDCCLLMCSVHEQAHRLSRSTRSHAVHGLSSGEELEGSRAIPRCALHPAKPLTLFCTTCSKALCEQCREAGAHGGQSHHVMPSDEAACHQRQELKNMRRKITEPSKSTEIRTALDEVIGTINALNSAAETASAEIGRNADELVAMLRQRERELLDKLEELRWRKLEPLEKQREDLEKRLSDAERTSHYCEAAVDRLKDEQLLESTGWLRENLQTVATFCYEGPTVDSYVAFIPSRDGFNVCLNAGFGCVINKQGDPASSSLQVKSDQYVDGKEAKIFLCASLVGGQRFAGNLSEIGMKVEVTSSNNQKCPVQIVQEEAEGNYTISFTPDSVGQHQVVAMVNNQHVRGSPLALDIKPFTPQLIQSWRKDGGEFTTVSNDSPVALPKDQICSAADGWLFQLQLVVSGKKEQYKAITNISTSPAKVSCTRCNHSYTYCDSTGDVQPHNFRHEVQAMLHCTQCSHSSVCCPNTYSYDGSQYIDPSWSMPLLLQTSVQVN